MEEAARQRPTIEITPARPLLSLDLREVWEYRELLFLFAWRDATVRYKQSVVGIGWAVVQPLTQMIIFSLVFGAFAKLPSEGVPYPIFSLCALVPWNYFARSLADASHSLVGAGHLLSKIYFPRLILPISRVFSGLIDFVIALVLLLSMMAWYRVTPSLRILALPLFLLIAMITAFAVGLWLTALNVKYRDVGFVIPFLLQIWLYASPVAYSSTIVPPRWRAVYALNPIVSVVDGFRWALLGKSAPDPKSMLISLSIVALLLVSGLWYFTRTERTFADLI